MDQPEIRQANLAGRQIVYQVVRSARRSLEVRLDPERGVVVRAPLRTPAARLDELLRDKAQWVLRHLASLEARGLPPPPRAYASGELYAYLGRDYALELREGRPGGRSRTILEDGHLVVVLDAGLGPQARALAARRALGLWYRRQAQRELPPAAERYAALLGLGPPPVMVRDQKRRWGSCNAKGEVRLNWRLVMAPRELSDYVAAHEACHLKVAGHGPAFWELLARLMPDCRQRRRRLGDLGPWLRL